MHSLSIRHKCPMQYATGKRTKFTNSSAKKLDQEISDSVINIGLTSCRLIQFLKTIEKTPIPTDIPIFSLLVQLQ
jgi:hypothetical protein